MRAWPLAIVLGAASALAVGGLAWTAYAQQCNHDCPRARRDARGCCIAAPAPGPAPATSVAPSPNGAAASASGRAYAQLEGDAQVFASQSWSPVVFQRAPAARGVTVSGSQITFAHAGAYQVTLGFRMDQGCPDWWTAVRLFGGGADAGHSVGFGTLVPGPATVVFIATVSNATVPYQLQVGRDLARAGNGACNVSQPARFGDVLIPAVVATVVEIQ